jgi:hypothetical protein
MNSSTKRSLPPPLEQSTGFPERRAGASVAPAQRDEHPVVPPDDRKSWPCLPWLIPRDSPAVKRASEEGFPIVGGNRLAVLVRNAFKPFYEEHKTRVGVMLRCHPSKPRPVTKRGDREPDVANSTSRGACPMRLRFPPPAPQWRHGSFPQAAAGVPPVEQSGRVDHRHGTLNASAGR